MTDTTALPLPSWESFYLIVGSSAAALTGLMFVVITLMADNRRRTSTPQNDAFGTPTVVHFSFALLISAALSAPWNELSSLAVLLGISGAIGLIYAAIVTRRAMLQNDYHPVLEDWLFHTVLPVVAYAAIIVAAVELTVSPHRALFAVGASTLLLIFTGIHNAWDIVTYITFKGTETQNENAKSDAT